MAERPPFTLSVASPCCARWSQMEGNSTKRFCGQCRKHVYDLSAMRWDEVKELLEQQPSPCVRFYQRQDGTVMTADCPEGKRAKWKRLRFRALVSGAVALVLAAVALMRWHPWRRSRCDVYATLPPEEAARWSRAVQNVPFTQPDAQAKAEPPPDETWMEQRRARLPGGAPLPPRLVMGLIRREIKIIRQTERPEPSSAPDPGRQTETQ